MKYLWTAFDKLVKPRFSPIASLVFDDVAKELKFYSMHHKVDKPSKPDFTIIGKGEPPCSFRAMEFLEYIKTLFDGPLVTNNLKSHIIALDLPLNKNFNVYEVPEPQDLNYPREITELKKYMWKQLSAFIGKQERWQSLLAEASVVYLDLERRGVLREGTEVHPIYELTTYSGRSKSMGFSIQGAVEGEDIASTNRTQKVFICADWIAADPRGWALLSQDEVMQGSYKTSDPYMYLAQANGGTRADYKVELIKAIYSQRYDSVVFRHFPQLKQWVVNSWEQVAKDGFSTSVMGRKFHGPTGPTNSWTQHDMRSVFNAQMQGSTAHAMQNVMVELHRRMPGNLLTELHDSVVLCADNGSVKPVIDIVKDVMLHPFKDILPTDPVFPLRISIGTKWKQWKQLREYRA